MLWVYMFTCLSLSTESTMENISAREIHGRVPFFNASYWYDTFQPLVLWNDKKFVPNSYIDCYQHSIYQDDNELKNVCTLYFNGSKFVFSSESMNRNAPASTAIYFHEKYKRNLNRVLWAIGICTFVSILGGFIMTLTFHDNGSEESKNVIENA
uniref:Uncharacterized protein n=1 Tax=Acrobeloides nanus TaxID=290746 RepID=A0A914CVB3_9BILA